MRNIKLIIEYDGTSFCGWGKQPGKSTVQASLEEAIELLTGERVKLTGASRTDAGVHASGQVVNFRTRSKVPVEKFPRVLQTALPHDVVVRSAEEVGAEFNARRLAKRKLYSYMIACGDGVPVIARRYVWDIPRHLDILAMKKAAKGLLGRHNFSSFALSDKRRKLVDPFREIYSIKFKVGKLNNFFGELGEPCDSKVIKIEFKGNSFLYKMIRGIVGTLVDVGRGKIDAGSIKNILFAHKRSAAGRTAPAKGLSLVRVDY